LLCRSLVGATEVEKVKREEEKKKPSFMLAIDPQAQVFGFEP